MPKWSDVIKVVASLIAIVFAAAGIALTVRSHTAQIVGNRERINVHDREIAATRSDVRVLDARYTSDVEYIKEALHRIETDAKTP